MKRRRKVRVANPVARLRRILGKSQTQFASMIGVSLALVKAVERGARQITEKLDRRVRVVTGAALGRHVHRFRADSEWRLLPEGQLRSAWQTADCRGPYSLKVFEYHQKRFRTDPQAAKDLLEEIVPELERMFLAAAKPGVAGARHRLPGLEMSLRDWMAEADVHFKLGVL